MTLFAFSAVFLCLACPHPGICIWVENDACSQVVCLGCHEEGVLDGVLRAAVLSTALEFDLEHVREQHVDLLHEATCALPAPVCKVPQDQCHLRRLMCPSLLEC